MQFEADSLVPGVGPLIKQGFKCIGWMNGVATRAACVH